MPSSTPHPPDPVLHGINFHVPPSIAHSYEQYSERNLVTATNGRSVSELGGTMTNDQPADPIARNTLSNGASSMTLQDAVSLVGVSAVTGVSGIQGLQGIQGYSAQQGPVGYDGPVGSDGLLWSSVAQEKEAAIRCLGFFFGNPTWAPPYFVMESRHLRNEWPRDREGFGVQTVFVHRDGTRVSGVRSINNVEGAVLFIASLVKWTASAEVRLGGVALMENPGIFDEYTLVRGAGGARRKESASPRVDPVIHLHSPDESDF
jgi:hypothetical protein